jgi:hypothetical protein
MMTSKQIYSQIDLSTMSIFHTPNWLNAVCGENWDVCIKLDNRGELLAYMPYHFEKTTSGINLKMPPLTPFLGPTIIDRALSNFLRNTNDNNITNFLFSQLPSWNRYNQSWHFSSSNLLLPIAQKKNFLMFPKFTYFLKSTTSYSAFFNSTEGKQRNSIRSGLKNIRVSDEFLPNVLLKLIKTTFKKKGLNLPYSEDIFFRVCELVETNKSGYILTSYDTKGQLVAGGLFVTDKQTTYYLAGGVDTSTNSQGAMSVIIHDAIVKSLAEVKNFDFEGSILPGVEDFFRSFGTERRLFFTIQSHNPSFRSHIVDGLRHFRAAIKHLL